jgi:hypothetical protein
VAGEEETLTFEVLPADAADKSVEWTSSNPEVATVANGVVSAVAAGEATITATAKDESGKSGSCAVTVTAAEVLVTSVELNKEDLALVEEASETLIATVLPDDATDSSVTWDSSNDEIATVDANGLVVAVSAGTATISVTANDGSGLFDECEVMVEAKEVIEYIDLVPGPRDLSARYLGGTGASEFYFRVASDSSAPGVGVFNEGFILEGFTTETEYADFIIAPGVYTVTEDAGAPFTLRAGYIQQAGGNNLVYGTFTHGKEGDLRKERVVIEGTVTVEYDNGIYTFMTDLTGYYAYDETDIKSEIRYCYTGGVEIANEAGDPGDSFIRSEAYYMSVNFCDIFMLKLWRAEDVDYDEGVYLEGYCDKGTFNMYGYLPGGLYNVEDAMYSSGTLVPGDLDEYGNVLGTFYFVEGPVSFSPALSDFGEVVIEYDDMEQLYDISMTLSGYDIVAEKPFTGISRKFEGPMSFINADEASPAVPQEVKVRMEALARRIATAR